MSRIIAKKGDDFQYFLIYFNLGQQDLIKGSIAML